MIDPQDYRFRELMRRQDAKIAAKRSTDGEPVQPTDIRDADADPIDDKTLTPEPSIMSLAPIPATVNSRPQTRSGTPAQSGIHFDPKLGCWLAKIRRETKIVTLGQFDTRDLAEAEYQAARKEALSRPRAKGDGTDDPLPPGVRYDPKCNKYVARCSFPGQKRHLGSFATIEQASRAYEAAKARSTGQSPNRVHDRQGSTIAITATVPPPRRKPGPKPKVSRPTTPEVPDTIRTLPGGASGSPPSPPKAPSSSGSPEGTSDLSQDSSDLAAIIAETEATLAALKYLASLPEGVRRRAVEAMR